MKKRDEGRLADYCMKAPHVIPNAGKKHAENKTAELPHAKTHNIPPAQGDFMMLLVVGVMTLPIVGLLALMIVYLDYHYH
jgi:hypothetical protein